MIESFAINQATRVSSSLRAATFELHIAVFLFGVSGLFGKLIVAGPATIVAGRTAFAAIVVLIAIRCFGEKLKVESRKKLGMMILSGLVLAIHWLMFFHAIQVSTVAIGLIGYSTFPVFVTFLEPLIYGQRLRRVDIGSAIMVSVGLILVAPSFDLSDSGTQGLIWAVVSGALFAVLTLMNRRLVESNSSLVVVFYQHGSAALAMLPFAMAAGGITDAGTLWELLVLGVVCTALPQVLFIKSLKVIKAQLASIVACLEPVYGILLAALFLKEIPGATTILGTIIVLSAVIVAMKSHSAPWSCRT